MNIGGTITIKNGVKHPLRNGDVFHFKNCFTVVAVASGYHNDLTAHFIYLCDDFLNYPHHEAEGSYVEDSVFIGNIADELNSIYTKIQELIK